MFKLSNKDFVLIEGKEYVEADTLRDTVVGLKDNIHDVDMGCQDGGSKLSEFVVLNTIDYTFSVLKSPKIVEIDESKTDDVCVEGEQKDVVSHIKSVFVEGDYFRVLAGTLLSFLGFLVVIKAYFLDDIFMFFVGFVCFCVGVKYLWSSYQTFKIIKLNIK